MRVIIIGGGAAGLMAALTAARNGNEALLLEKQQRVGRKLLATGNGRCNLSNASPLTGRYHGEAAGFTSPALENFGCSDTIAFFRALGLLTVTEPDGRVYPLSDSAGSVLDVLRLACDAAGVVTRTDCGATALARTPDGFLVTAAGETLSADKVIVCCGGLAGGKLGGSKSGYELLLSMGHSVTKLRPALVQLKTDAQFVRSLKGVRADAALTLMRKNEVVARSEGEVQFTEYGVSGPAVFEISRAASVGGEGLTLRLDLLRSVSLGELESMLKNRRRDMPGLTLENLLTGMLHNRLGRTIIRSAGFALTSPLPEMSDAALGEIAQEVKGFTLEVLGTLGFDGAQVTAGGVKTDEFVPEALESRLVSGLYAAGEVLDVDGDCGGFNLQWAWSSGKLAGLTL